MAKLDSLSQKIINNNSYAELFLNYKDYLNGGYTATAKRLLDLIEHKLSEELKLNSMYMHNFRGYKNPETIDMVLKVNDQQNRIIEMINTVVRIKNSNNPVDNEYWLNSMMETSLEEYTNLVTGQVKEM